MVSHEYQCLNARICLSVTIGADQNLELDAQRIYDIHCHIHGDVGLECTSLLECINLETIICCMSKVDVFSEWF